MRGSGFGLPPRVERNHSCTAARTMHVMDLPELDAELQTARASLGRILAQADACLAALDERERFARRVRTAARRRTRHATLHPLASTLVAPQTASA